MQYNLRVRIWNQVPHTRGFSQLHWKVGICHNQKKVSIHFKRNWKVPTGTAPLFTLQYIWKATLKHRQASLYLSKASRVGLILVFYKAWLRNFHRECSPELVWGRELKTKKGTCQHASLMFLHPKTEVSWMWAKQVEVHLRQKDPEFEASLECILIVS